MRIILGLVFAFAGVVAWRSAAGTWDKSLIEGDRYNPYEVPGGWPFGGALWRGFVRTASMSPAVGVFLGLAYATAGFDDAGVPGALKLLSLAGAGLGLSALWSVALFSWPSFLIPPRLRNLPSAVSEWFTGATPPEQG